MGVPYTRKKIIMELQQTPEYLSYLSRLGWRVGHADGVSYVWRNIPLAGAIAKIQRPDRLPDIRKLTRELHSHTIRTIALEPSELVTQKNLSIYAQKLKKSGFRLNRSPFLATKTIVVDLRPDPDKIFSGFSEAKRRAVRKAVKNGVFAVETSNIQEIIRIKSKSAGLFGDITTYGLKEMREMLPKTAITGVLAYEKKYIGNPIGGILLVFHRDIAYYWIAGSTKHGKKLFAPSLLVCEAMTIAKNNGALEFDFLGIWDERLPSQNHEWIGFTKFKEGFGGTEKYYPISII
jgi:lipid II:glycine glycyltransferase (peptidoglycan interpeptide bridge formation enzyme)